MNNATANKIAGSASNSSTVENCFAATHAVRQLPICAAASSAVKATKPRMTSATCNQVGMAAHDTPEAAC